MGVLHLRMAGAPCDAIRPRPVSLVRGRWQDGLTAALRYNGGRARLAAREVLAGLVCEPQGRSGPCFAAVWFWTGRTEMTEPNRKCMLERRAGHPTGGIVAGAQIRAARAMLNMRRRDLALSAGLHPNAVKYWEARRVPVGERPYAIACIAHVLRQHGVEAFSDPTPGVRFVGG
jgi:hypothetical protein